MFLQLVWKEMKYQTRNITFYLFIAVVLMFYVTQFVPYIDGIHALDPQPGKQGYGFKDITDQQTEIKVVFLDMDRTYHNGHILKQSLLINKTVRLSEEQKAEIKNAMDKLASFGEEKGANPLDDVVVKASYQEYLEIANSLDKYLGGSTYYGDKYRKYILQQPMTYEDAKKEFEDIRNKDKVSNAYGRVFADYMGITAGLFPVFISAFVLTRDRRSRMQELIYCRGISSLRYVASKYFGILTCLVVVYLALAAHATYSTVAIAQQATYFIDILAFFKYTIAWIIPTLMFSTAFGMLVSIIFGNGVAAIFAQFVLWLTAITTLGGNYELYRNVIRFNRLGMYDQYISWLPQITSNRIFYTVLSITIVIAAAWVLSMKRGSVNGFKTLKNSMVQHKDIA